MQDRHDEILLRRPIYLSGVLFSLILLGCLRDGSGFVASLRGDQEQAESTQPPRHGYYEALLNLGPPGSSPEVPQPPPGWVPFGGEQAGIVEELQSYHRWKMRPNLDTTWYGASFRTNSHGFRTPEIPLEKPLATYRIVVFRRVIKLIQSVSNQHGLDYLDLSDAFDDLEADEFCISDWDKRPSARGHRAIFAALRDALLRRGGLPGLPFAEQLAN